MRSPATIPNMVTLEPGGSAVIEVEFEFAQFTVDNAPSGGTMIAVPVGLDCSASNARTVNPSDGTLPPGEWTFFYEHDDYGCAPGPEGHELFAGVNSPLEWLDSSLRVTGAPNGFGSIWAVSGAVASSSCTDAGGRAIELASSGGNVGPVTLPAGDWYVFAMESSGGQPSGEECRDAGLVAVPYGEERVFAWPAHTASVTVTNIPSISGGFLGTPRWRIIASPNPVSNNCGTNPPGGAVTIGSNSHSSDQVSGSLAAGTWYIVRQRTNSTGGCLTAAASPITIGWAPSYTLDFQGSLTP